jgi:outer membrane lipoprotein-sorting protein
MRALPLLALPLLLSAALADDAPGDLDEVFRQVDANAGRIRDLRAEFRQEKKMKILKRPQVSVGSLSVRKLEAGSRICWESWDLNADSGEKTCPQRLLILGDEKLMITWSLDDRTGERTDLGKGKFEVSEFLTIGGSLSGLKKSFAVELASKPAEGKGWELRLAPTSERLKRLIKEMRLEVDPSAWLVSRIFVLDSGDNTTDIRLTKFSLNEGVDEEVYKVPSDVKLTDVKLDGR